MRFRFALTAVLFLSFASLPAFSQYQWGRPHPPKAGACFYQDVGFRGDYFCMKQSDRWAVLPAGFNDKISAIRVFGGSRVRIFNDVNFQGSNLRVNRDLNDLRRVSLPDNPSKNWNDRISSISIYRDRDDWDRSHP